MSNQAVFPSEGFFRERTDDVVIIQTVKPTEANL